MQLNQTGNVKITKQVTRSRCQKGKLLNQYLKIRSIGQGPFSKIKLMIDINTNIPYAMKKYNMFILKKKIKMGSKSNGQTKYSTQADQVYNQIQIMKKLDNPYVVKLHQILYDEYEEKIYLFMDYCQHGDITQWDHKKKIFTTKWSLIQVAKYFKEISLGLQYLHSLNIVHRDIKPQNILITQQQKAKLIDFGRSVQLNSNDQRLIGSEGTHHFMAPETISQKIIGGYNGKLCDIWSLGVSLFCCVMGYLPFYDENLLKLFEKIQNCQYKFPKNMSEGQKKFDDLIKNMLLVEWTKRPSLKQISSKLAKIQSQL